MSEPESSRDPIRTPLPQRMADFRRRRVPIVVWSVAALAAGLILFGRARRYEYVGLAQAGQYEVSAGTVGRIRAVLVDVYDQVESGDVIARLDDEPLAASIETATAMLGKLEADLNAARLQAEREAGHDRAGWRADLRRFQIDEEQRRIDVLGLRVTIESDQVEREREALELERSRRLLETGLIGQSEFDLIRLRHEAIERRVEENRGLLARLEDEYQAAAGRREEFERRVPSVPEAAPLLRPLREAIEVANRELEEIEVQRKALVLRSPVAGQVSQVLGREGQSVVPGEPIVTIAEGTAREIVTWLAEGDRTAVDPRMRVELVRAGHPETVAESFVVRVGPTVEALPERLWPTPTEPRYGRAVVIAAVPGRLPLIPGERVEVRFLGGMPAANR